MHDFSTVCLNKSGNKKQTSGSLLILFSVMASLDQNENIDQMHENTFLSSMFIEMNLMTSSIQSHDTNSHFWILIMTISAH